MAKCEICGKAPQFGNNRSFSMRATRRKFLPNLQQIKMVEKGQTVRKTACTKCIKTLAKNS
ncbi:MAG: 50S ribosomal protein L28 [Armatimonadetes bacterium]|nr:50S ribosomal protein L28 [Anaerolineae bacterium]